MGREEQLLPATKGDILRIHEKLDDLSVAVTKLEGRPVYRQPCQFFADHLMEHKTARDDWKKAMVGGATTIIVSLIVAYLAVRFGLK